ncbi:MAG: nitrilase-related carbon-nitrogen hydrolase, partial [Anaerolineae bacterium]
LIPPLASIAPRRLLKGEGRLSGLIGKVLHKAAVSASQARGGIKGELEQLLEHYPGEIYDAYIDLFSAAALKYNVTLVAGSFYLPEQDADAGYHTAYVFAPDGMILGRQKKIHLSAAEADFCRPGEALQPIQTPVGRLGLLINEDALYPECARMLAFQGAEILVNLIACAGLTAYRQMRHAFLARVDENELLGVQSALVGSNLLAPGAPELVGKSALLQPIHLSNNGDGLLAQINGSASEGVVAAAMNLERLKEFWVRPAPRLRQSMQTANFIPLGRFYRRRKTLDRTYWNPEVEFPPPIATPPQAYRPDAEPASDESAAEPPGGSLRSPFTDDARHKGDTIA